MRTTWEFYRDTYGGTRITDETRFGVLQLRALLAFNRLTFNRLKDWEGRNETVELVLCQLIDREDVKATRVNGNGNGISSENVDGYSVSYVSSVDLADADRQEEWRIVSDALAHTGLLDRSLSTQKYRFGNLPW